MSSELALGTFEDWTFRFRVGTSNRVLLLLHGWTGDENSMTIFTRNLPSTYWIFAPRAPYPASPRGFSWRAPAPRGSWPSVDLFRPAIDKLLILLDHWASANKLDLSVIDVAGFQPGGGIYSNTRGASPRPCAKNGNSCRFCPAGRQSNPSSQSIYWKEYFYGAWHTGRDGAHRNGPQYYSTIAECWGASDILRKRSGTQIKR